MTSHLAAELRRIADAPADIPPAYRDRLRMLAAELDVAAAEQQCRAAAAQAIGWRSPGDTDTADYADWWWAEVDRLATYVRTGDRP